MKLKPNTEAHIGAKLLSYNDKDRQTNRQKWWKPDKQISRQQCKKKEVCSITNYSSLNIEYDISGKYCKGKRYT